MNVLGARVAHRQVEQRAVGVVGRGDVEGAAVLVGERHPGAVAGVTEAELPLHVTHVAELEVRVALDVDPEAPRADDGPAERPPLTGLHDEGRTVDAGLALVGLVEQLQGDDVGVVARGGEHRPLGVDRVDGGHVALAGGEGGQDQEEEKDGLVHGSLQLGRY